MNRYVKELINIDIDSSLIDCLEVQPTVYYQLDKLTPRLKSNAATSLRRGWCNAGSGKGYILHQVLCAVFDIPVFVIGRNDTCIFSIPNNGNLVKHKEQIDSEFKALWLLINPNAASWWWRNGTYMGHNDNWIQMHYVRPPDFSIEGLTHLLKVDTVLDFCDKKNILAALTALEQNVKLDISNMVK